MTSLLRQLSLPSALRFFSAGSAVLPIGFYLGDTGLAVAQAERQRKGAMQWRALYGRAYPTSLAALMEKPADFRSFVQATLRAAGCRGRHVVSALPAGQLKIISTTYPVNAGQSTEKALIAHLRERLRDDLTNSVIDYLPIRDAQQKVGDRDSALVALAKTEDALAYLNLLTRAGLEPQALDIGPAALARLVRLSMTAEKPINVMVIHFGLEQSFLSLMWGRKLILDRSIAFCENALIGAIASAFDMPPEQAQAQLQRNGLSPETEMGTTISEVLHPAFVELTREIGRVMVYFASQTRGAAVHEVHILGALAEYPGLMPWLTQELKVPVRILNPMAVMPFHRTRVGTSDKAGLALAAGLALRREQH